MPIFRVKSVKIYTGQKEFTRACSWRSWQISGMYLLVPCVLVYYIQFQILKIKYLNLLCRGEMSRMCLWGSWPPGSGDFNQSTATNTEEVNIQSPKFCSLLFILFILTSSSFATPILLEQQQCQKRALSWVGAKKPHINTSPWMPFILAPPHHSSCFQYNPPIFFQIVNEWIVHE